MGFDSFSPDPSDDVVAPAAGTPVPQNGPSEIDLPHESTPQTWITACVQWCGADGAAVVAAGSPGDANARAVTYATDGTAAKLADLQYVLGVGPHAESMADGRPHQARVSDDRDCDQWAALVDELHRLDVAAVRTFPIGPAARPLGTLQMHWHTAPSLTGDITATTTTVAASIARRLDLLTPRVMPNPTLDGDDMLDAVDADPHHGFDRNTVNTAIGVLMATHRIAPSAAAALLRADAYSSGSTVTASARTVLSTLSG